MGREVKCFSGCDCECVIGINPQPLPQILSLLLCPKSATLFPSLQPCSRVCLPSSRVCPRVCSFAPSLQPCPESASHLPESAPHRPESHRPIIPFIHLLITNIQFKTSESSRNFWDFITFNQSPTSRQTSSQAQPES